MTDNTSTWYNSKTPSQPHSRFSPEAASPFPLTEARSPTHAHVAQITFVLTFTLACTHSDARGRARRSRARHARRL
jgi:hypothetical protein